MSKSRLGIGITVSALGLALAGCAANASSGGGGDIASVNDQKISRSDFTSKLEALPQAKAILNQQIRSALVDQYATANHLDISDADLDKKEADIKSKYPPGQFEQILKQQSLTEADVRKILREQLIVEKAVGGTVKVSDADIQSYLSKNHATLDTAAQVRARHILVADAATAGKVEGLLHGGGDFAALAKQYSTDPSSKDKGGELGFFSKGQMVAAFQDAAFSQPLNVVGKPVKSPFGYHIIEVEEKKPAQVANMANSRTKIHDLLLQQQDQQQIPLFISGLQAKANIQIFDDKLKDAVPPAAPPGSASAPAAGSAAAPATAASK